MDALSKEVRPELLDWSKPIELYERDGGVYQVVLIGFDGEHLAVVRKVNYDQYTAFQKYDGTLKGAAGGSTFAPRIRNKVVLGV